MKIISWNCNGAFRCKFDKLLPFEADIWVVQESESPEYLQDKGIKIPAYTHWWHGDRGCKGLSIFTFNGYKAEKAAFFSPEFKYALPVVITPPEGTGQKFLLVGVWASVVKENHDWDYIGQMCEFMERYRANFDDNSILIGDLNSNMLWNSYYQKAHNYSRFLELMAENGLVSVYHQLEKCAQGQEKIPTSYYHRDPKRGFHIDYAFMSPKRIEELGKFEIAGKKWLEWSDHVPLLLEINDYATFKRR